RCRPDAADRRTPAGAPARDEDGAGAPRGDAEGGPHAGRRAGARLPARCEERPMSDLAYLTVAEAAELLRAKKLSPVEYTKALIDRVEKHDKKLNAFLRFTPDKAMDDAKRAEAEITRGEWRGPFHG